MSEKTVFDDGSIIVTTARILAGGTTYAVRNITSVRMNTTTKEIPRKAGFVSLLSWGVGGLMALFGFSVGSQGGVIVFFIGMLIIGLGYSMRSRKGVETTCSVVICASSGESRVLESEDCDHVQRIVDAINEALVEG